MKGKVCVVTGASAGIGQATALALARMGATVALVCRNRERAEKTCAAILAKTGNSAIEIFLADLSSLVAIRRLAYELSARYPQIHVLVNNAGIFNWNRATTVDGIEAVFAVNHLAYFLLSQLLLERLRASAPARIVNVASDAHRWGALNIDDLQHERSYRPLLNQTTRHWYTPMAGCEVTFW
jgi:NAD(P)-dependent dehydrogenase (short-subunit alcohol dehydrogenase family)